MTESPTSRIGLALGSGAARGWAHLGVLRALDKLGIRPQVIAGTSIGALVGGFYLSDHMDALEHWARSLTKLRLVRYMDFKVVGNGLIAGNRLFAEMERYLGDALIEDMPTPFGSVATDLYTGHEVWLTQGRLVEALRASFSLPGFFEPTKVGHRWLIDGALVNPVPVSLCHALGADVVIAVNLNTGAPLRNGDHVPRSTAIMGYSPLPRWSGMVLRGTGSTEEQAKPARPTEGPSMLGVMAATLNIVQDRVTRSRLAAEPPDVHIVPKVSGIGLLDFDRAAEAIEAGEAAVHQAESDLRAAMTMYGMSPR